MREFIYDSLPGRVVFGIGAFDRLADEVAALRVNRLLLIADRTAQPWADQAQERIGVQIAARINEVRVHVPLDDAEKARALAEEHSVDGVITIGGGSATGLGKAVALTNEVALTAVPTTYAGSEMTPIWGLTSGARKETGRDRRVQPQLVIYDPRLTYSLPPNIAGPSGMNALAHCAEALYASGANPITSLMAEEGIRVLANSLPFIVAAPDDPAPRTEALMGAYLAGASFAAAGSGIHHKICHVLGGLYDLPHGEMHTVVLPHSLAFNAPAIPDAMARMASALGDPDVPGAVFDLALRLNAPTSLAAIGMPGDRLGEAAEEIVAAAAANPRTVTKAGMERLLADAYVGRRPTRLGSEATSTSGAGLSPGQPVR